MAGTVPGARSGDYGARVRRFRLVVIVVAMAVVAAGCGGGGGTDDEIEGAPESSPGTAATTVPVPTTSAGTTVPGSALTLRMTDLRLLNSEESDNGLRVLLPAGVASASVTVTGLPTPNRVISVCQANELERRLSTAACRMPANGEAVTITLGSAASGVEIIQVGVSSSGAAGSTTSLDEVTIKYSASSREVNVRLPQIASGESGGRPTFALTPAGTGNYRATLTWSVIQVFGGTPSNAQLELVQGGNTTNKAEGGGLDVRLTGTLPAPATEAAIRVSNLGSAAMVSPKVALLFP
jgi:hypothetical protein